MVQMGYFSLVLPQCRTTYWHEIETPQNFCHWLLVSAIHSTVYQDVKMVAYFEEWLTRSLSRQYWESHLKSLKKSMKSVSQSYLIPSQNCANYLPTTSLACLPPHQHG